MRCNECDKEIGDRASACDDRRCPVASIDIQEVISRFSKDFQDAKELKEHLIDTLEKEFGIGIVVSYPLVHAALRDEYFHYNLAVQPLGQKQNCA